MFANQIRVILLISIQLILISSQYSRSYFFNPSFSKNQELNCSVNDQLTNLTIRPKINNLIWKVLSHKQVPSAKEIKDLQEACNKAKSDIQNIQCKKISDSFSDLNYACRTVSLYFGPYGKCHQKLRGAPSMTECVQTYYAYATLDTERCQITEKRFDCLYNGISAACDKQTADSFKKNRDILYNLQKCTYLI